MPRKYDMRKRAEQVEETRRRITEAAVELHGTVGMTRTTVSAIAERAGVERLTVYRHFPDETALFHACSSHWLEQNPMPDPGPWAAIADPRKRLRTALGELFPWYRRNEGMMGNFVRDGSAVPALAARVAEWRAYQDAIVGILASGWNARARRRRLLLAVLGHATDFTTWASLAHRELDDAEASEVMVALVEATVAPRYS